MIDIQRLYDSIKKSKLEITLMNYNPDYTKNFLRFAKNSDLLGGIHMNGCIDAPSLQLIFMTLCGVFNLGPSNKHVHHYLYKEY